MRALEQGEQSEDVTTALRGMLRRALEVRNMGSTTPRSTESLSAVQLTDSSCVVRFVYHPWGQPSQQTSIAVKTLQVDKDKENKWSSAFTGYAHQFTPTPTKSKTNTETYGIPYEAKDNAVNGRIVLVSITGLMNVMKGPGLKKWDAFKERFKSRTAKWILDEDSQFMYVPAKKTKGAVASKKNFDENKKKKTK